MTAPPPAASPHRPGAGPGGPEPAGPEPAGPEPAGPEPAGPGPEAAGPERTGPGPRAAGPAARGLRADRRAAGAALALVVLAAAVGAGLGLAGRPVRAPAAPLFAHPLPHVGPGTPAALAVAALVVVYGPALAARLRWGVLLAAGYAAAVAWTLALALVDGWSGGLAGRLTTRYEYLSEVDRVGDVSDLLRDFAGRIVDGPDAWATHVAGHPPGALLVFAALDRAGLGGGGPAALACVLAGAAVAVAVPVTVRALGGVRAARAAVPFAVLFPGAVWVGASADGLFAGVAATGLALLAVAVTRGGVPHGAAAGLLLGCCLYLSYGLVLLAPLVVAVLLLGRRRVAPVAAAVVGALAVAAAFTAGGFWWVEGYHLLVRRYYAGLAAERPYAYWVWANLAAAAVSAGPAAAAVLRRAVLRVVVVSRAGVRAAGGAVAGPPPGRSGGPAGGGGRAAAARLRAVAVAVPAGVRRCGPAVLLPVAGLVAVVAADVSGLSKAEVERIWLPFLCWSAAGAALLPVRHRRGWLAAQAGTALLVNHLLLTAW